MFNARTKRTRSSALPSCSDRKSTARQNGRGVAGSRLCAAYGGGVLGRLVRLSDNLQRVFGTVETQPLAPPRGCSSGQCSLGQSVAYLFLEFRWLAYPTLLVRYLEPPVTRPPVFPETEGHSFFRIRRSRRVSDSHFQPTSRKSRGPLRFSGQHATCAAICLARDHPEVGKPEFHGRFGP